MAADPQRIQYMSVEEYLAYDRASEVKHEYIDGYLVALAGGTTTHSDIAVTMTVLLREHLGRKGPCRVYGSDMRVLATQKRYFYPDVVVSCEVVDHTKGNDILYYPRLIVEVLSPSTEAKDRGMKFTCYQQRPSLQEYVLVNTRVQRVEVFRRQPGGEWLYQSYSAGEQVVLSSVNMQFPVAELYAELDIPVEDVEEDE